MLRILHAGAVNLGPLSPHAYHSNAVVDAVGDVEVALAVDATTMGSFQSGVSGVAAVAIASLVTSGYRGYDAGVSVDPADGVILGIYNYHVVLSRCLDCRTGWLWERPMWRLLAGLHLRYSPARRRQ